MMELDGRFEEMVALWTAPSAEELHRALVLCPPVLGDSHDAFEPLMLFRAAHSDRPEGAAQTALLLLTDRRWRRATHRLVREIDESGLVPKEQLDLLAGAFLAADDALYWQVPPEWFDGAAIVLDDQSETDDRQRSPHAEAEDPVVARPVLPPLRRWAAARVVRAEPDSWPGLVQRARQLGSTPAAAVVAGLVDAVDVLPPGAREAVLVTALGWGARGPRLAALEHLARNGQCDRACEHARHDPDAAIRRWGRQLEARPPLTDPHLPAPAGETPAPTSQTLPARLF